MATKMGIGNLGGYASLSRTFSLVLLLFFLHLVVVLVFLRWLLFLLGMLATCPSSL